MKGRGATPPGGASPPARALLQRGLAAFRSGRGAEAVRDLAAAANQATDTPTRAAAFKGLGLVYNRFQEHQHALDALRRAEALDRNDAETAYQIAVSLRGLGRLPEAADAAGRALAIQPDQGGVGALLVDVLVRLGRDDEAVALVEDLDRRGVVSLEADVAFVSVAMRRGEHETGVGRLRRHAFNESLGNEPRSRAFYSLGDLYDAMGLYDQAWEAYKRGNDLKGGHFDVQKWDESLNAILRVWTTETVARLQEGASEDATPVLVVGMPRSGTTLTEMTLGRHPRVHMGGETMALTDAFRQIGMRTGHSPDARPDLVTGPMIADAATLYSGVMHGLGRGAARVTNKLPMNVAILGLFAAMFPRGTIIHCRRDPRDVCLSCYFRNFQFPNPFTHRQDWLAAYYRGYAALVRHWGRVLAPLERCPTLHEVRYDELVTQPEPVARGLVEAVGLPWDPACARVGSSDQSVPTLRADQVGKPLYTTSKGRWANYERHLGEWADLESPSFWDPAQPG